MADKVEDALILVGPHELAATDSAKTNYISTLFSISLLQSALKRLEVDQLMPAQTINRASEIYRSFILRHAEQLGLSNRMALAKSINGYRYRRLTDCRKTLLHHPDYLRHVESGDPFTIADGWYSPGNEFSFARHRILEEAKAILAEGRAVKSKKGFMVNHLTLMDLARFPAFVDVALHPTVLSTAASYLGMYPVMSSVKLLVSAPGTYEDFTASQQFHLDHADTPMLKLIINIDAVTAENGPFCFLPAAVSKMAKKSLGYGKRGAAYRVADETMYSAIDHDTLVMLQGEAGDIAFVDTSRCFHYGSRNASRERRIVMYSFSTPARSDFRKPTDYSAVVPCETLVKKALLDPFFFSSFQPL